MSRKLFIVLFLLVFLVGVLVPIGTKWNSATVNAISAPTVVVTPNVVGQQAEYKITFTINQSVSAGDSLYVVFPSDTLIPCSTCNPYIPAGNFTINNVVLTDDVVANSGTRLLWIKFPISISSGSTVTLDIKKGARIENPTHIGEYQLQVSTSSEPSYVLSQPYKIEYSKVSEVSVQLSSSIVNTVSEYTISFSTGVLGALSTGEDSIFIQFPSEVQLPNTIYTSRVSFNGEKGKVRLKLNENNVMQLIVLQDVNAGEDITIDFAYDFGIKNPSQPGHYPLVIWTSKEPSHVTTYFDITDKPTVQTSVIVTPSIPDGSNGWFITQPIVVLVGTSNVPGGVASYYSIDTESNFKQYIEPIVIPDGVHTLYYYSTNPAKGLQENVKKKLFKVNINPPVLNMNVKDGMFLRDTDFTITGSVKAEGPVNLTINGKKIQIDSDGSFADSLVLSEGQNTISINLTDQAGHTISKQVSVFVDSIPPILTITTPTQWEKVNEPEVDVTGKTESGAKLTINGEDVPVNADGTFDYTVKFKKQGMYLIKVVATDEAGNQTIKTVAVDYTEVKPVQIILQIGNNKAILNGKTVLLDSAPFIDPKTNRTLVPLRFIAEAFNAKVLWDGELKTITIIRGDTTVLLQVGNDIAVINGTKSVKLDQPPVIVNSRTMVPIRFVSEILGATVEWNPSTRTITITMQNNHD